METVSATGVVIPPFIVWKGKTHRQSYNLSEVTIEATFAVSDSGYIDNDIGLQYIKTYFKQYTRDTIFKVEKDVKYSGPTRCLIVEGHLSHIACRVIQYAIDNNVYMICLPSKSTYELQPLDIGCFGVLQTRYKKNVSS